MDTQQHQEAQAESLQLAVDSLSPEYQAILSDDAMAFLTALVSQFSGRLDSLLARREVRQQEFDQGKLPGFRADTADIRNDKSWKIAGIPEPLQDRRVEITGPVDRKMVINALNSGAKVFMCCFEDATAPSWDNMVQGQINLRDANLGEMRYFDDSRQKEYVLNDHPSLLIARPRGLHLPEQHIQFQGKAISGCLMDFGLYFFHNYQSRAAKGLGVYYYLPKLESMEEGAWWADVFRFTENYFGAETGTIKATVLIETLPAVFEMDEILYAMRDYIVAMNCGRWDYIFSYIKTLKQHKDRILPDRHDVTMAQPFLTAYSQLLIATCHQRGALAMGGMSAFIPSKDPEEMKQVLEKVIEDKERESSNGHDGTWVAHPGLVDTAMTVFNQRLGGKPNQLDYLPPAANDITADDLLAPCEGHRNEAGVRKNIRIALLYIEAWIRGLGCVPIHGLMEDAATAEISRANIWQWIHHGVTLDDGQLFTSELFRQWLQQEVDSLKFELDNNSQNRRFDDAAQLFDVLSTSDEFAPFLTLPSYPLLVG
nr:malate synthase A [Photobacterium sp. CCB-ST2H9]